MTVLALATVPENKQKSEKQRKLPSRAAVAPVRTESEVRTTGRESQETPEMLSLPKENLRMRAWRELVAGVVVERVFGAPVRLQGFRGVRVLRQFRFTPDERPLLPLLPRHLKYTRGLHEGFSIRLIHQFDY